MGVKNWSVTGTGQKRTEETEVKTEWGTRKHSYYR